MPEVLVEKTNPVIVALDVPSAAEALQLIEKIGDAIAYYKVGMELYAAAGREFVSQIGELGKKIFLDLKLYDIGETVKRATEQLVGNYVSLLTVHGSRAVMEAAVAGRGSASTKLLAVTVLTSFDQQDLAELGFNVPVSDLVDLRVRNAVESGMDGVICSPLDARRVRELAGPGLTIVTPGVRSHGSVTGDQKRFATPREAMDAGANYLVIGRQITRAADPRAACEEILAELCA